MGVYKLERCKSCGYKRRESKPIKTIGVCVKCQQPTYYSKNFYFSYYLNSKKYEKMAGANRKAAQEAERKMKVDVAEGVANIPTSWPAAVEQLERTYRNLSPKTVNMYENSLNKLGQSFDKMKLTDITDRHLQMYKDHRLKQVSGASFNRDRSTLKRLFALSGIPWRFRKTSFEGEPENVRDRILSEEERDRLMSACKRVPYLFTAILVGLDTGFRKQSILTLHWRDIDWKKNQVKKIGKGGKLSCVPLTDRLRKHLLSYRGQQSILSLYVFPSPTNPSKPITDIRKSFQSACRSAGLSNVNLQDLRRTFGSFVTMATKDITLASELLGHADISTTRKHYGHLLDDHKRDGVRIFEEATN